jgi:asparagine synthase (glutamine-hydrolysing)
LAKEKRRRNAVSVQFGRGNLDGLPADERYLAKAESMLAPYGPDGGGSYIRDSIGIFYRAFHTTEESRRESQPCHTPSGAVLTWDGRLDNRAELARELREHVTPGATDLALVAAAHEAWGTACFAKLVGDWALSVWDPRSQALILAKDPVGTRPLYYSFEKDHVTWSTVLDPLVLLAGKSFRLEKEYLAGWLSFFPATHLTPYVGIHSVPPSCFVRLEPGRRTISKYWDFDPSKRIRYRSDPEYEEHFRQVFAESVRRRLRSDSPIVAELSGGMDSSSIVCTADDLSRGMAATPRIDTLSYYDNTEPNWNELPYAAKVEERRGRAGHHISVTQEECFRFDFESGAIAISPAAARHDSSVFRQFSGCLVSSGSRVVLSGIAGDEVMGGVPTPVPELAELLRGARLLTLAQRLKAWALAKRVPWTQLLWEASRPFLPPALIPAPHFKRHPSWLDPGFVREYRVALSGYEKRLTLLGPRPSFRENLSTLDGLRRQLACSALPTRPAYELRYPFLDRELLEFLFAIPRDQLVRPGQRRSLMRRALAGVVPLEILNRKRKAYVVRGPMAAVSSEWNSLADLCRNMACGSFGIAIPEEFERALNSVREGRDVPLAPFLRSITLENWLRNIVRSGISDGMQQPSAQGVVTLMPGPGLS